MVFPVRQQRKQKEKAEREFVLKDINSNRANIKKPTETAKRVKKRGRRDLYVYMCNNNNIEKGLKTNQEITEENRKKRERWEKYILGQSIFLFCFSKGCFFFLCLIVCGWWVVKDYRGVRCNQKKVIRVGKVCGIYNL